MVFKKTLTVPIYDNNRLCIVATDNEKEITKITGVYWDENAPILAAVVNASDKKGKRTIFMILNPNHEDFKLSVITHEAVHVANRIFFNIGHTLEATNDEPQAYLTEWVFDQVLIFLEKCKDECNKKTN